MDRRELLKRAAAAGAIGVTGIVAYDHLSDRPPADDPPPRTPDGRTPTGGRGRRTDTASPDESPPSDDPTPPPEETPVRHGDEFGTVVDAVQAGADPEGNEPIGELLRAYAGDDTLLSFRAGTYRLPRVELTDYEGLGISAAHEEHPTFVAPADSCTNSDPHVQFAKVSDFLLEGIDFDFTNRGAGGAINVIADGDATVRDLTTRGSCRRQITMFRIDIRNPDGTGLVENVRAERVQDSGWITGGYVGKRHSGEVTFRDCEFNEFTDNGLYGSTPGTDEGGGGVVHTVDGRFENNNVSNIRLGSNGSSARNDTIVVESAPDAESINLRGIRFRRGADQVVENCDIRFGPEVTNSFGAIVFHADNAGARVADTQVTMDSDRIPAVNAFYHSGDGGPTFENLTVDGEASRGYAVQLNGRDGTTFRNCEIAQGGDNRDGIRIAYSSDCELIDSRIDVTSYPLILRDSTVTIRNTTFVTPDGERHVEHMEAGPGDFRPGSWS